MSQYLFTIVCEYDGGTYVSQVRSTDERHAMDEWAIMLRREKPIEAVSELVADAVDDEGLSPTPLEGLTGAWCWTASIDDKLALATIVQSA